jgi:tetratricopeptide (TPR) repeat protein
MSCRPLLVLIFMLFARVCTAAAPPYTYDFSANCNAAYHQVLSLHYEEARALLIKEFRANPYNLMATYVSDYEDFIYLMLNCDKEEYAQRKGHFDSRLKLLEQGDESSPWYRFCKAGLYMHWTVIYMRFGEHLKAANMFRKSFGLLKENQAENPGFEYNDIFYGFEEAIVGSLPSNYKWLASIAGISGSIKGGVGKLEHFVDTHTDNQPFRTETQLYLQYTRFYFMGKQKEVWEMLNGPTYPVENNLLNAYFRVYLAMDYSKSDEVIRTIHHVSGQKDYNKYPFFNFLMGMATLSAIDSTCIYYFQTYLKENKGDIHVKDAWVKMAYYWYISGHQDRANYCRAQIAKAGSTELDVDRNAEKFGSETEWPDKRLLEARLLIDGGYFARANILLTGINVNGLKSEQDKSEYYYRLGRVQEEAGALTKAAALFDEAIQAGHSTRSQFPARAALHKGRMYEVAGDKTKGARYYQEALDMPAHDFQNNIDLQAKAGLNRIHEKI